MSDREMLEKAARAAGYTLGRHTQKEGVFTLGGHEWNPRDDDGDSFRLAVRLGLSIEVHYDSAQPLPWLRIVTRRRGRDESWVHVPLAEYAADPDGATRLAILRAAAERADEA